jgi:Tfp pilus assembly protein PilF
MRASPRPRSSSRPSLGRRAAPLTFAALAACASAPAPHSAVEEDPLYREARRDLGAERPQSASEKLERLVPKYGPDPVLLRWLGRARILAGKGGAGRENLRQVLEQDPGDTQARLWLADSCFEAGADLDADARAQYELLLARNPEDEHLLRRLAALHLRAGDERQALEKLELLLKRLPADRALREDALLAADGSSDWPALVRHAEAHLAAHGRSAIALQAAARGRLEGDPAQAPLEALRACVPLLGEALLLEPSDPELAYALGLIHLQASRKGGGTPDQNGAERYLRRALDADPRHLDAAQALAALYEDQRNPQRALPLLEHALQILLDQEASQALGRNEERLRVIRQRIEALSSPRRG